MPDFSLLMERRDKPGIWTFLGRRSVDPQQEVKLPVGYKLVSKAPPYKNISKRWLWRDSTSEFFFPTKKYVINQDGVIVSTALVIDDSDITLPSGWSLVDFNAYNTVTNEAGESTVVDTGDTIDTNTSTVIAKIPRYNKVPVEYLQQALANNNLTQDFITFVESKGYTIEQVQALPYISLNNKLLREFVTSMGFTMQQAYNQLQKVAEQLKDQEDSLKNSLLEEE